MPAPDYANLEEAWDTSAPIIDRNSEEAAFYRGAFAVLYLLHEGRSSGTLLTEIEDWADCFQQRVRNAARAN